jgi:hypothetical protein
VLVIKPLDTYAGGCELISTPIRGPRDWLSYVIKFID